MLIQVYLLAKQKCSQVVLEAVKSGQGGGWVSALGWGNMAASGLSCRKAMVGT